MIRGTQGTLGRSERAGHLFFILVLTFLMSGCAGRTQVGAPENQLVVARTEPAAPLLVTMAPTFILEGTHARHNRIGRAEAKKQQARETVTINTDIPVIYAGSRSFATAKGTYTNLIYRIHFPATPFSLVPFYLGGGKNVGLLVILTLDARQRPLLVTTAGTCGCYAVSIPTQYLSPAFYPDDWPTERVSIFGEQLPARLPPMQATDLVQVVVRADVHRVEDLRVVPRGAALGPGQPAEVVSLETLNMLPLDDGTFTSFYYEHWPLTGHVKGAIKPWETLSLSLVSLDFFIGMDKEYGDAGISRNPFYTSLKPWNRKSSDMNDFAAYLRFNGWKL